MCGIAGIISHGAFKFDLPTALEAIAHRGPDHSAHFSERVGQCDVQFGHRRLSIIDLSSAGHQPMHAAGVSIIYNGEVYNYKELRAEHLRGESFNSDSDTEVILKLYLKFGKVFVNMLNGDFAIALLDRNRNQVLLLRDRLGIKPLYLYQSGSFLSFASEIKAFKAGGLKLTPNESEIGNYLVFKYTPLQNTLFAEVSRLAPGHMLEVDLNTGASKKLRYWNLPSAIQPFRGSYADAKAMLRVQIQAAVERRLVGDVPIANYLSGGVDSSIIAHYLRGGDHKHYCAVKNTVDTAAEGTTSDGYYARKLASEWNLQLEEIPIGLDQLSADHISRAVWACDDLIADGSVIPAMLIAEQAAKTHRVVLSGMGADEIFLGYNGHMLLRLSRYAEAMPGIKMILAPLMRSISAGRGPFKAYRRYLQKWGNNLGRDFEPARFSIVGDLDSAASVFRGAPRYAEVFEPYFNKTTNPWEGLMRFETDNFLVKNLHYLDRSSMAYGLESRVPFLDHELVEFAAGLPLEYKLDWKLHAKHVLKDAYADVLPRYITHRRKAGFGMPLRTLLSRPELLDKLMPLDFYDSLGCLNVDAIKRIKTAHLSGRQDQSALLYALVSLRFWYNSGLVADDMAVI
jgi:asparagine synthase (glutamine-hydrolysing)